MQRATGWSRQPPEAERIGAKGGKRDALPERLKRRYDLGGQAPKRKSTGNKKPGAF